MARLPASALPKASSARSMAPPMFVPPRGMRFVSSSAAAVEHGVVGDRQRSLQKRAARERHQPQPVAAELADEVLHGKPRAGEAVGRDIRGEHTLGHVHDDDEIQPAAMHLPNFKTHARFGHRQQEGRHARQQQHVTQPTPPRARRAGKLRAQTRHLDELHQPTFGPALGPQEQRPEHGQGQQPPEPRRRAKTERGEGSGHSGRLRQRSRRKVRWSVTAADATGFAKGRGGTSDTSARTRRTNGTGRGIRGTC